jgi:predicted MFS family arabinose efflux permease
LSVDRVNITEVVSEPTPGPALRKAPTPREVSPTTILTLAAACGLLVANIYYAQPLIAEIARSLGLATGAAGLIVTMSQIGYGVGLLFVVPLGDLVENRRLILISVALSAVALACAAFAPSASVFLACAAVIGLGSVAVQILIPLAAHLAPDATRGRVVGTVSSGLMIGIMLARPVSSFVAAQSSWRVMFGLSAAAMVVLAATLSRALPRRVPRTKMTYGELMGSMVHLVMATPVLRRRAFYQACLFFAFSLFWTTIPLLLAGPYYGLTQNGIALFALAGVSGAIAAPIGGRVADRGWGRPATGCAIGIVALSMLGSIFVPQGSAAAILLLVAAAIAIDFGCQANLVLGFRAIFSLAPDARGRLNGVYLSTAFVGGAIGSALGAWAYARGGWSLACCIGLTPPLIALARFLVGVATGSE